MASRRTRVVRGLVLTPLRQRLIADYRARHEWLWKWSRPSRWSKWDAKQRAAMRKWEAEFLIGPKKERRPPRKSARHGQPLSRTEAPVGDGTSAVDV